MPIFPFSCLFPHCPYIAVRFTQVADNQTFYSLELNTFRNLFSVSGLLCSSPQIPPVKHKTKLLWGSELPSPFNIKFKKDMAAGGWQLTVGNHIRWPLYRCDGVYVCDWLCVCVVEWDTVALQGSSSNEWPCCWQDKYCCIQNNSGIKRGILNRTLYYIFPLM